MLDRPGFVLPSIYETILTVIYIINFVIYGGIMSFGLVFTNLFVNSTRILYIEMACSLVVLARICIGFTSVKVSQGRRLERIRDIG